MNQDEALKQHPKFLFARSAGAIFEQKYRDALEILQEDVGRVIESKAHIDSIFLLASLASFLTTLELQLQAAYGEKWETLIPEREQTILRCSFCGRTQTEVAKLIAGPSVYICNGCIEICNEILEEAPIPAPQEGKPLGEIKSRGVIIKDALEPKG